MKGGKLKGMGWSREEKEKKQEKRDGGKEEEEEDADALEAEMEALEAKAEDGYTRTNRLFMESDNETSAGKKVTTWLDNERGQAAVPPPPSHPIIPQPQKQALSQPQHKPRPLPKPQPHLWGPAPAPETQPSSSQQRPGSSSMQRSPREMDNGRVNEVSSGRYGGPRDTYGAG